MLTISLLLMQLVEHLSLNLVRYGLFALAIFRVLIDEMSGDLD